MAKVKKALRREKGSGGVYKARGYYYLQYTPEKGTRKAVTLRSPAGERITDFREAETAAAEFLQKEKALQSIESREQYLHEVAKVKQLRAKLTIATAEAFELANGKPNVPDVSEKHQQRKRKRWSDFCRYLRDNFKIITIDEVTPSHAEQYVSYMRAKGYWHKPTKICLVNPDEPEIQKLSNTTINRAIMDCRWVFNQLARDLGYSASDNPFCDIAKLKEEPVQREVFTDDDLRAIFRNPPPLMEALFTIGLCTGLREGDVATLRWREIITYNKDARGVPDFYVAEIERVTRKTKAVVSIPVEKELADFLSRQWEISGGQEYVVPEAAELYFASNNKLSMKIIKYLQSVGIQTKIVRISNNSKFKLEITLQNIYKDYSIQVKNLKTDKILSMKEKYENGVNSNAVFRNFLEEIPPKKSYIYETVSINHFFKFEGPGSYSMTVSGIYYAAGEVKATHYKIEDLEFKIE